MSDISESDVHDEIPGLAALIVSAFASHNAVKADALPELVVSIRKALVAPLTSVAGSRRAPAVPVEESIFPDHIVCLEDGRKLTMLKRHLRTAFGLSPDEYRARWDLPSDYPMVAPNYAARRSALSHKIKVTRRRRHSGFQDTHYSSMTAHASS